MWCAGPGWRRCGGRPGCSTRRRSFVITSGVTGRRGSRDSVGSAASPRSTGRRRHAGRDAAQSEEDVNDNRIEHRSAVLLVRRHAPTVWGVCRRMLRTDHDAEDAFQAAFLVFIQKATTLPDKEMVGNWLYGVAH